MRPRKVICLIDSDETTLSMNRFLLELKGYRVISAQLGKPALKLLAAADPNAIRLVVCNANLRDMSGFVLAQRLREIRKDISTIVISPLTDDHQDMNGSVDHFIGKSRLTPSELVYFVNIHSSVQRGPKRSPFLRANVAVGVA